MGFRINTNIAAMDAHQKSTMNNRMLDKSLGSLASGLRINSAADDSSGLVIADSLRSQANSLGQAVRNANDAIGIIQTADKAMDEQIKILDTIKTKAIQAASDTQSASSREAIQKDVNRLIEQLDNIAKTTSFNGQTLLSGNYENKEYQVGAYSNQTIKASITDTQSSAIGNIQQTDDTTALGNTIKVTNTAGVVAGSTTISVGADSTILDGLGKGDVIKFAGDNTEYTVKDVAASVGTIELANQLTQDVATDALINVVANSEIPEFIKGGTDIVAGDASITLSTSTLANFSQMQGLAAGDVITVTNSAGISQDLTIKNVDVTAGTISFGGATINEAGTVANNGVKITLKSSETFDSLTQVATAQAVIGSTTINLTAAGSLDGLGQGDIINFDGDATDYVIEGITASDGTITLASGLQQQINSGATISVKSTQDVKEQATFAAALAAAATTFSLETTELNGLAAGDIIRIESSTAGSVDLRITDIATSSGLVTFETVSGGALAASGATGFNIVSSSVLGDTYTSTDYAQYTVEGITLSAVQMTDDNGSGVAGAGLGQVADLINATTDVTGVKATAVVESTGGQAVSGTTLTEDIVINGEVILAKGTTVLEGDSNKTLLNAINAKATDTGVSATLSSDGVLSLSSDGRAISTRGLTDVAGINEGVNVGVLEFTKNDSSQIDVSAEHFRDAALTQNNEDIIASTLTQNSTAFTLQNVVFGENDAGGVGLLRTRDGAQTAMDITEAAINALDASRADLGAAQNQLVVTVNNISVTAVNVKAAESQIRDVDFAAESANFSRLNILAQSGSYAMSQANAIQQNVLRLLQ